MSESRSRALEGAVAVGREWLRAHADREAADEAARAERERVNATPGHTLEDLLAEQRQAEWQVISQRIERLQIDIDATRARLAAQEAELAMLVAQLP